ncbi:MAG: PTS sugar transporter subunit IIA [Pseudomonadota bacterium]|nr:PTS sugar transporter subunit IIA [Pseudomonadota bacterium]
MPMNELLAEDRIVILAAPGDRGDVIEYAARLLAGDSPSAAVSISQSLHARERLASTAIGHGVAIPHGRTPGIEQSRGAFMRLETPVDFGAVDGIPVDLVLAMSVPEHFVQQHLQQLAELAERFASAEFRERLRDAPSARHLASCLLGGGQRRSAA